MPRTRKKELPNDRRRYYAIAIDANRADMLEGILLELSVDYARLPSDNSAIAKFNVLADYTTADIMETKVWMATGKYEIIEPLKSFLNNIS